MSKTERVQQLLDVIAAAQEALTAAAGCAVPFVGLWRLSRR